MAVRKSCEIQRDLLTGMAYQAAQAFFCKIPVIGAKFVCGLG